MDNLFIGAGKGIIAFPEELFPLEGFCGVHDAPLARVLVIKQNIQVAIVALELVMAKDETLSCIRKLVSEITKTPQENIWIHLTHTITTPHTPGGPLIGMGGVILDSPGPAGTDKEAMERKALQRRLYEEALNKAVRQAATEASLLKPAEMKAGTSVSMVNINRDVPGPAGWWIGQQGTGPSDHQLTVITFTDPRQQTIGSLISFGIKPCTIDNSQMEENLRQISSDLTGTACQIFEEKTGAPALFLMAAAGDQVPRKQAWYDEQQPDGTIRKVDHGIAYGLRMAKELGTELGHDALEALKSASLCSASPLTCQCSGFHWPAKAAEDSLPRLQGHYTLSGQDSYLPVLTITLGDVALVGTKPEINCITGLQLKEQSPFPHTLLAVMVNGGMKYMPDQDSYDRVSWEAIHSRLMPGAAERFVKEAATQLQRSRHFMEPQEEA